MVDSPALQLLLGKGGKSAILDSVQTAALSNPEALPQVYAAWRCRMLVAAVTATAVGLVVHGPTSEVRYDAGGAATSFWLLVGLLALLLCAIGPGLIGGCLALAAVWRWRRLRKSSRLARAAWILWVLGPLPVLMLPVARLFDLNVEDAIKTSANQVRYLLTVTAPAFFALLPGTLRAALVLKRFLPESKAPAQIIMLAAPACTVAYLLPLGVLAQLAFHRWLYLGVLLLALSPVVPLAAVRWLQRRESPAEAARLVHVIVLIQGTLAALGLGLIAVWLGENPLLRELLGHIDPYWVVGLVANMYASQWLTTVVVSDLLLAMLHQVQESAQTLTDTAEGEVLAHKIDALGGSLAPPEPAQEKP